MCDHRPCNHCLATTGLDDYDWPPERNLLECELEQVSLLPQRADAFLNFLAAASVPFLLPPLPCR